MDADPLVDPVVCPDRHVGLDQRRLHPGRSAQRLTILANSISRPSPVV
jgi:hypothetical protein